MSHGNTERKAEMNILKCIIFHVLHVKVEDTAIESNLIYNCFEFVSIKGSVLQNDQFYICAFLTP